ncbi:P-loop NTPase [Candidatus Haliotispira prima]|uniref:Iron-sulfur cluster carrier protein n=1 Tax=Candidatus Haliotispira prima TaxID=3034016 RepID=A0ABY8MKT1_9SPIO|nr:P-loop NTPase [Candidatus Haliotispira prima]
MATWTKELVLEALKEVNDPDLGKDLVTLGMIDKVEVSEAGVEFTIVLTTPACPLKGVMERDARQALQRHFPDLGDGQIRVCFDAQTRSDNRISEQLSLPIKNILAVSSGKGGVGKSSVTVNLALALAQSGAKVGILDADIYGPNVNIMLGNSSMPTVAVERKDEQGDENPILAPAFLHGIHAMSIGYLVESGQALAWRGPMLHGILRQLLLDTEWPDLDYLLIDMPPGTGDIQLSIPTLCPVTAAIVVSSPQKVALSDTRRGITAFGQLKVPILGLIENMAGEVFGRGGGEAAAKEMGLPFLGRIELDAAIRDGGDRGCPIVLFEAESSSAKAFVEIAGKIAARLAVRHVNRQDGEI